MSRSSKVTESVATMARKLRVVTKVRKVAGRHAQAIFQLPVVYNPRFTRKYGLFRFATTTIELAPWLENDLGQSRDTFLHEVAHAIRFLAVGRHGRPHGAEWKRLAAALGATPKACGTTEVGGQAKYRPRAEKAVGRCESCEHVFYGRRALARDRPWSCSVQDGEGLVCHGDIRVYRSRAKRRS